MSTASEPVWETKDYPSLNTRELHEILRVRQEVFVLEQGCIYLDADELDSQCAHLCGRDPEGTLIAYARILPPGLKYSAASFGRVLVIKNRRGTNLGRALVRRCIDYCHSTFLNTEIRISAQHQLVPFYGDFGFKSIGEPYNDAGILHLDMILAAD